MCEDVNSQIIRRTRVINPLSPLPDPLNGDLKRPQAPHPKSKFLAIIPKILDQRGGLLCLQIVGEDGKFSGGRIA